MKNIFIYEVENGWIAEKNFNFGYRGTVSGEKNVYVYRTIAELQAALPDLLADSKQPEPKIP